ncbi:MAG: nucleoside hydrolase [Spirochaetales bacterium]|nr:nucleoside hydrolase [Spirochaetales bacterium]
MIPVIIDCDPGHDDMIALMFAAADPKIDLLGVTTVAGNQTGEKTYTNALKILTLIGETALPLGRGADVPLFRELTVAPEIHGVSGLDGADLPEVLPPAGGIPAVDLLEKLILSSREKVTLVPTGPLTNIALTLLKNPSLKEKIRRIILMGGALFDSNITPAAEFNIYVDPEAADIVFRSGLPITMVGLDVTNKALIGFDDIQRLEGFGGPVSRVVAPLLRFFAQANKDIFGFDGAPVHDALAVAAVTHPEVISTRHLSVAVETEGTLCRGRTVADVYGVTGAKPNVEVALELDHSLFLEIFFTAMKALEKKISGEV